MQDSYREIFLAESDEYLNIISQCLVKLEKTPSDSDALNEIFRAIHTLKGMAATMGFENLTRLSHQMEDLLDALRGREIELNSEIIDSLFTCLDIIEVLVQDIKLDRKSQVDINACLEKIQSFLGGEKTPEEIDQGCLQEVVFTEQENETFRKKKAQGFEILNIMVDIVKDCAMKSVRAFLVINNLERTGEILKGIPDVSELKEGRFGTSFVLILATKQKVASIQQELFSISEIDSVQIHPLEILQEGGVVSRPAALSSPVKKIQSMRIPVERLDKIMNLMGELSIAKIRLVQVVQAQKLKFLEDITFAVDRLTTALQDEVMQTRLLPISYVLDTFPRIVRDLARSQNKEIDFSIAGSEIELDRTILDEIGDALVHLVRNAIDHGIESQEERESLSKDPRGRLEIDVVRQKGQIVIEIKDDGRGIDFEKVIQKAVQKGMLSKDEAAVSVKDKVSIFNLLTTPGFSTSAKVSEISGRGVGLDVVKSKMEALGGRLDFDATVGQGSQFVLTLPLTLAIIKAMLVKVRGETFAVPLMSIRETIKIEAKDISSINNFEVIRIRDEVVPILRLEEKLEILNQAESSEDQVQDNKISVVIIEYGTKSMGLMVSKVIGELDIVVKPLGSMVKRVKGIAGATILGDGRVALILDVLNLT